MKFQADTLSGVRPAFVFRQPPESAATRRTAVPSSSGNGFYKKWLFLRDKNPTMKIHRRNSRTFLLIILGMLSAFGPFVTDFYLPGLPSIGDYFDVPASMVQLSLTSSMLGLAGGNC